jgi:hypothetical protein
MLSLAFTAKTSRPPATWALLSEVAAGTVATSWDVLPPVSGMRWNVGLVLPTRSTV